MYVILDMRQVGKMAENGRLALITLGSNNISIWGDAAETVQKAMLRLNNLAQTPVNHSPVYATPAFPAGSGPDFANAAMAFQTALPAPELLAALHQIEDAAERTRKKRWGPRTLDIDLIGLGDAIYPDLQTQRSWMDLSPQAQLQETPDQLILPHPRVQDRSFALVPLADVAPDWRHPVIGTTIRDMLDARPAAERAAIVLN
jgi:2-amino-4-hydroxy-6-hydroxymethyldihydropteridine diphosphokinase